nr:putative antennal esterase CXE36 [Ectropis grisescens]
MADPVVNTKLGKVKGKVSKNENGVQFYTFKGIPYAKPPVGELRFAVPQPADPWKGVRDGTKDCNFCAQFDKKSGTVVGDEDCLYLNVYTPKLPKKNSLSLPVMVYFHGGGFVFGDGTVSTNHGPEFLIEKDVVLIIPNYRLGILGFLSLDRKEAPGNMGLRDQVEALKWVQKNIASFGGDANNVTIFGISAGGASVEYLLLSPTAKGLFHKAIAQSGTSLIHWAQNNNVKELASKIPVQKGKSFTSDDDLLSYLKEMPFKELISSSMAAIQANAFKGGIHFGFVPTVEKPTDWEPFLSKSTYNLLARGEFTKVPYMVGVCTREGLLMVSHCAPVLEKFIKEKKFTDYFPFELDDVEITELEARLKQIYLEGNNVSSEADAFAIDFFGDADFFGGVHTAAMLISKHNSPVYFYEFAHDGALNYVKKCEGTVREGACHGDEGGYLLKNEVLTDQLTDADEYVQNVMLELWTNFAKNGDPNPKSDNLLMETKWEPISETGTACFVINEKPYLKDEIFPERAKLYEEFYEKKFGEK